MVTVKKGSVPEKSGVRDRVALLPGALLTGSTVPVNPDSKNIFHFAVRDHYM